MPKFIENTQKIKKHFPDVESAFSNTNTHAYATPRKQAARFQKQKILVDFEVNLFALHKNNLNKPLKIDASVRRQMRISQRRAS